MQRKKGVLKMISKELEKYIEEQIESILQKNHLVKTEDELFEDLVLQDENYTALKDYLQDASYITGYQRRYQQLTKNIVAQELAASLATIDIAAAERFVQVVDEANEVFCAGAGRSGCYM